MKPAVKVPLYNELTKVRLLILLLYDYRPLIIGYFHGEVRKC